MWVCWSKSFCFSVSSVPSYCTRIKPIALMCFSPLSGLKSFAASFPHVLESSVFESSSPPPVPNPILESQPTQLLSSLPRIPILALDKSLTALNPSLLQFSCKDAFCPISAFHVSRPSEVLRYCPSASSECRESAFLLMITNLICWLIFIPRQTLEKGVFQ